MKYIIILFFIIKYLIGKYDKNKVTKLIQKNHIMDIKESGKYAINVFRIVYNPIEKGKKSCTCFLKTISRFFEYINMSIINANITLKQ